LNLNKNKQFKQIKYHDTIFTTANTLLDNVIATDIFFERELSDRISDKRQSSGKKKI